MAEKKATVRIDIGEYGGKVGNAIAARFERNGREETVYFPSSFTVVTEHSNGMVDLDCPLWFARKEKLDNWIVAEY